MLRSAAAAHARDPAILMWDMLPDDLECLLNFMYHGEVNVTQEKLNHFLDLAERLQVRGLTSGGDKPKRQQQQRQQQQQQQQQQNSNPLPKKVALPTAPMPHSMVLGASQSPSGSNPKRAKLSLAAINTDLTAKIKEELTGGVKTEDPASSSQPENVCGGLSDDEEDDDDFPIAPPVVTEMSGGGGGGGGGGGTDDGGVVSDFDSSAYLDNDASLDDRGGLPLLPQFIHDAVGGGTAGLSANQIEPIVGPDGSKGEFSK